jgi:hypothetical protein
MKALTTLLASCLTLAGCNSPTKVEMFYRRGEVTPTVKVIDYDGIRSIELRDVDNSLLKSKNYNSPLIPSGAYVPLDFELEDGKYNVNVEDRKNNITYHTFRKTGRNFKGLVSEVDDD